MAEEERDFLAKYIDSDWELFRLFRSPPRAELFLRELISLLRLKKGDFFPFDRQKLASNLSINLPAIAEALQVLKLGGIVDIKQSRGTIVREPPAIPKNKEIHQTLWNLNMHSAILMAKEAALNSSRADRIKIESAYQLLVNIAAPLIPSKDGGLVIVQDSDAKMSNFLFAEKQVHAMIRQAAHDKWGGIIDVIAESLTAPFRRDSLALGQHIVQRLDHNRSILDSIQTENPSQAGIAVANYFHFVSEQYEKLQ